MMGLVNRNGLQSLTGTSCLFKWTLYLKGGNQGASRAMDTAVLALDLQWDAGGMVWHMGRGNTGYRDMYSGGGPYGDMQEVC